MYSYSRDTTLALAIGKIGLETGEQVSGFLCEPYGLEKAVDITRFGGWRNYLESSLITPPPT